MINIETIREVNMSYLGLLDQSLIEDVTFRRDNRTKYRSEIEQRPLLKTTDRKEVWGSQADQN